VSKTKAQLRYGLWPDSSAPVNQPVELTAAARRLAATTLTELNRLGVAVKIDEAGRAHFRAMRIIPLSARRMIERQGDLIEAFLLHEESGR
jgi:hypothetical protein